MGPVGQGPEDLLLNRIHFAPKAAQIEGRFGGHHDDGRGNYGRDDESGDKGGKKVRLRGSRSGKEDSPYGEPGTGTQESGPTGETSEKQPSKHGHQGGRANEIGHQKEVENTVTLSGDDKDGDSHSYRGPSRDTQ